jgi:hypothetical protein
VIATYNGCARGAVAHGQAASALDPIWRLPVGQATLLHVEHEFSRTHFAGRAFAELGASRQ